MFYKYLPEYELPDVFLCKIIEIDSDHRYPHHQIPDWQCLMVCQESYWLVGPRNNLRNTKISINYSWNWLLFSISPNSLMLLVNLGEYFQSLCCYFDYDFVGFYYSYCCKFWQTSDNKLVSIKIFEVRFHRTCCWWW